MTTVELKSIDKTCRFPTKWEEVSVSQFIALQQIEDELLPLLSQMNALKAEHDALLQEIETLYFSKGSNELAELEIASKKNQCADLESQVSAIKTRYAKLDSLRCCTLAGLSESDFYSNSFMEAELLRSLSLMLFDQPFTAQQPELEGEGVWVVRCPKIAGQPSVKVRYYLRHLAEYPTCIHQVYHALLKNIRNLSEKAAMERTAAELELASLFVLPRAEGILYALYGGKPEKIDFDSGKFNEKLEQYWQTRQKEMQMIPITALKGIIGFFLPHWESYFRNQAPMQA